MTFTFVSKPKQCPNCKSNKVASILMGMPNMDDKLQKDLDDGKVVLGGCSLSENDPSWKCVTCDIDMYKKERKFCEYERKPRKCPICLSKSIATVYRNYAVPSGKVLTDIEEGRVTTEFNDKYGNPRDWMCNECESSFYRVTNKGVDEGLCLD